MPGIINAKQILEDLVAIDKNGQSLDTELLAVQLLEVAEKIRKLAPTSFGLMQDDPLFVIAEEKYEKLHSRLSEFNEYRDQIGYEAAESMLRDVPKHLSGLRVMDLISVGAYNV